MRFSDRQTRGKRLSLESLEQRNMLSGHGVAPVLPAGFEAHASEAAHIATTFALNRLNGQAVDQVFGSVFGGLDAATVLTAQLTEAGGTATGHVTLLTTNQHGESVTKLNVSISGAEPDTTLDIKIGDTVVGQVTTDSSGDASAVFSSNPKGGQEPFLVVPTADDGSNVTIGALTGQLDEHGFGGHDDAPVDASRFFALLTDATGSASGVVKLHTLAIADDTTVRLSVAVRGAAPDSDLDVMVGDTLVGQIHTDASGNTRVTFSSDPKGNQQPLLAIPTADTGVQVSVGTLNGELGANFGFQRRHH